MHVLAIPVVHTLLFACTSAYGRSLHGNSLPSTSQISLGGEDLDRAVFAVSESKWQREVVRLHAKGHHNQCSAMRRGLSKLALPATITHHMQALSLPSSRAQRAPCA